MKQQIITAMIAGAFAMSFMDSAMAIKTEVPKKQTKMPNFVGKAIGACKLGAEKTKEKFQKIFPKSNQADMTFVGTPCDENGNPLRALAEGDMTYIGEPCNSSSGSSMMNSNAYNGSDVVGSRSARMNNSPANGGLPTPFDNDSPCNSSTLNVFDLQESNDGPTTDGLTKGEYTPDKSIMDQPIIEKNPINNASVRDDNRYDAPSLLEMDEQEFNSLGKAPTNKQLNQNATDISQNVGH